MADILGSFRKRAEELIGSINSAEGVRSTIEGLRRQMAEADRRRAVAQARGELKRLDAQINEMVTAVGVQAVGLHRAGRLTSSELTPLCEHIIELESVLEQQRRELQRLEEEARQHEESSEAHCLQCGRSLPDEATFCPYCGAAAPVQKQEPEQRFCAHCGAELREGSRYCARCGMLVTGG